MFPYVVLVSCMIGEVRQSQWESVVLFISVCLEKSEFLTRVSRVTYLRIGNSYLIAIAWCGESKFITVILIDHK